MPSIREWESDMAFVMQLHERETAAKTPSGANAPYKIFQKGARFEVRNNTGETKATFDSYAAALKYLRALYVNVKGAPKRAAKVPFSGKGKQRIPKGK